jgi:hypothetical protein
MDNAIPLQKRSLKYDVTGHSNHPRYDRFMEGEIGKILTDPRFDDLGKFEKIQELVNKTKTKLEVDVLLGNRNVNDIVSW